MSSAYLYPSAYPLRPAPHTSSLGRLRTVSSHVQTISASLPRLVHHGCHSHLLPDYFIPNLIPPSVPTHPSQHPHLLNAFSRTCEFLIANTRRITRPA
ncbi:hypothetical protein H5410_056938 [Solanum commersonii]|uniref:Uncharacterized protein n=1 Tax=Solanum commersonii TaxID=4109 RepID=A0A9J5WNQ0_SOLCO|nr:hypothetical protein H5410_056938 [Solanum commersonii]